MIYCKNKIGRILIDDEFNIKATSQTNIDLIEIIKKDLKLAPENGSPTYILANELKIFGFTILDLKLPPIEQIDEIIY